VDPSIGPALTDYYASVEAAAGEGFLDEIAAADLDPQLYPGGNPAAAALGAGEIGAALGVASGQAQTQISSGAPVEYVVYDGAWNPATSSMIAAGSPHPNAAQVYANWLVSRGQEVIAEYGLVPILTTVETDAVPEGVELWAGRDVTPDQAAAFQVRWDELFG
jgi:iron(III) transport system substrate-binding protein